VAEGMHLTQDGMKEINHQKEKDFKQMNAVDH
jgi:hypothetical protein